jgi:hypothetical protein
MWYIYTMEYYSAIKNNDFMKFDSKWMELENILGEVSQSQKNTYDMYSLLSGYYRAYEQLTNHMKLKKKEDQSVDASVLLRRREK